jgi:GNAT superfamily N-acetyltransferase
VASRRPAAVVLRFLPSHANFRMRCRRPHPGSNFAQPAATTYRRSELAHVIWRAHYPGIITAAQIDYMLERGYALAALAEFIDRPDHALLLALAEGEPAGFAAWYLTARADEAKLDKLYVLQARQRMGIGGKLLARVAEDARGAGAVTLILNVNKRNTQAIRAYEKHGFAIRESVVNDIGHGYVMDDFVMAKVLQDRPL